MTGLMSQVTCAPCNMKIDETKWKEHLSSGKHLQYCKGTDHSIAIKFFEMIFEARPEKKKILNLKNESHLISGVYIFQQNYQKRNLIYYVMISTIKRK